MTTVLKHMQIVYSHISVNGVHAFWHVVMWFKAHMCYDDPDKGHKPKVGIIILRLIVRLVFSKLWNNVGFKHYFMRPVIGMVYGGPT